MKKINLNAVAEAVAEANGGAISTELLGVLKKAQAAGLNAERDCTFEKIPAEPRRITLFLYDGENVDSWDTVRWIAGVITKLSGSRKVRVFADFHGFSRDGVGMSFAELAEKYGCSTRTVRDDIKTARKMIADEMRRQDAEVTAELAEGRRPGYLKSQAR